jgi:large subunit ribosomal protein L18
MKTKREMRRKRKLSSRSSVAGTSTRPRLAVFRSNTRVSAQLIDDDRGVTIASAIVEKKNIAAGKDLGAKIAQLAKEKKITTVVFDRGGFRYHGTVKAVADAAREGGLSF